MSSAVDGDQRMGDRREVFDLVGSKSEHKDRPNVRVKLNSHQIACEPNAISIKCPWRSYLNSQQTVLRILRAQVPQTFLRDCSAHITSKRDSFLRDGNGDGKLWESEGFSM
jgi:hypothetical protein